MKIKKFQKQNFLRIFYIEPINVKLSWHLRKIPGYFHIASCDPKDHIWEMYIEFGKQKKLNIVLSLTFFLYARISSSQCKGKEVLRNIFCIKTPENSLLYQISISREVIKSRLKMSFKLSNEVYITEEIFLFSCE
jgi:hypothetical protein